MPQHIEFSAIPIDFLCAVILMNFGEIQYLHRTRSNEFRGNSLEANVRHLESTTVKRV